MPSKQKLVPGRAQGRPLAEYEISRIIRLYEVLKREGHSDIRQEIHEMLGVSVRKISELWRDYRRTGKIPGRKNKEPWNKVK